jgi:Xaa-Pro aminopeptidase
VTAVAHARGTVEDEGRMAAYAGVLRRARADAFVLTSEAAVRHACGVHLYTQRLIPQRPVVCVLAPPAPPAVVCCVLEQDQIQAQRPGVLARTFLEFDDDPWAHVTDLLGGSGWRGRVVVEDTMPAAWLQRLRTWLAGAELIVSEDLSAEPRAVKDQAEQRLLEEASRAADCALAAGAALVAPGRTEREVAATITKSFLEQFPARATEVTGTCIGPQNNRSMHHVAGDHALPERGPVRLAVVGRVDGYWVLVARMLLLDQDPRLEDAYRRYLAAYQETMAALRPGAICREVYERCCQLVAEAGFELTTLKIAHGTGLDFRERPLVAPVDTTPLVPGMVLAYDYGLETERGEVLHVEDRVLIEYDGPRRLSDGWDTTDLRHGFSRLL